MPFPFNQSTFDHWVEKYGTQSSTTTTSHGLVVEDGGNKPVGWERVVVYVTVLLLAVISVLVLVRQNLDRINQFGAWFLGLIDRIGGLIDRFRARDDSGYETARAPPVPAPRLVGQNRTDSERARAVARARETCV